jgi:hypothetical protein
VTKAYTESLSKRSVIIVIAYWLTKTVAAGLSLRYQWLDIHLAQAKACGYKNTDFIGE